MPRILLVEDDDNQRLLYREALEEDGYEVVETADGRGALRCIEHEPPDAVVLDIHMPGMDGLHTLARIHDLNRKLPIVLNTAYAVYKEQFVSWLADAYVTKSSNLSELRNAVDAVLGREQVRPPAVLTGPCAGMAPNVIAASAVVAGGQQGVAEAG